MLVMRLFRDYLGDPWHNNSPLNDRVPDGDWWEHAPHIREAAANRWDFIWQQQATCLVCEGLYYGVTISLVSLATGLSVVTLNLHHRGLRGRRSLWSLLWWPHLILSFHRVPSCLRFMVFQVLAKILMMKIHIAKKKRPRSPTESSSPLYSQKANCCLCQAQVPQLESNK